VREKEARDVEVEGEVEPLVSQTLPAVLLHHHTHLLAEPLELMAWARRIPPRKGRQVEALPKGRCGREKGQREVLQGEAQGVEEEHARGDFQRR